MHRHILRVSSQDPSFVEFYERLAQSLGDAGTVYTPYPVIPPNHRLAVPQPNEILVTLKSINEFEIVYQAMRTYLQSSKTRRLTLEYEDRSVSLQQGYIPDKSEISRELFPI